MDYGTQPVCHKNWLYHDFTSVFLFASYKPPSASSLPLSAEAFVTCQGAPGLRRELILSTVWPAPSAGDTRDARALMPALEQLEPRRSGGTQRVTILTDPKNSLPSHKAQEGDGWMIVDEVSCPRVENWKERERGRQTKRH